MRLHKSIEHAFDRQRLYFAHHSHDTEGICLCVVLLDPALFETGIAFNKTSVKFETIHNHVFDRKFIGEKKPFLRLLALHAKFALAHALSRGWISDDGDLVSRKARYLDLARL